jgi:hypothetical protein
MNVSEFRDVVRAHFGERLERATPANVQEFVARVRLTLEDGSEGDLEGLEQPYEPDEVLRQFFAHVFDFPPSTGFILLWIAGFELWFAAAERESRETFAQLLRKLD